jgi:hypothetical protein
MYLNDALQSAFQEKVTAGGGGGVRALMRVGGRVYWWVEYRDAIGGKRYDVPGSYTTTYRLKTSSS